MYPAGMCTAVTHDIHAHFSTGSFGTGISIALGKGPFVGIRNTVVNFSGRHFFNHLTDNVDGLSDFLTANQST